MKKLMLIAAVMLMATPLMAGENVNVPSALNSNPVISADYGGVEISTHSFSNAAKLAFSGPGVVYGVLISTSGSIGEYVEFRDTNTANTSSPSFWKVYISSEGQQLPNTAGVVKQLAWPIRVNNGLSFNASVGTFNNVTVLYYKRRK